MDPITISIIIATLATSITFWDQVREWVEGNVFPFVKDHFPKYESVARDALAALDKVAVAVRNTAYKAWKKLRDILLKTVIQIERVSSNKAIRRVKSWLVSSLKKETVTVRQTEEELHWDDLPPDVAAEFMKRGVKSASEDYTKHRDKEFEEMELQA